MGSLGPKFSCLLGALSAPLDNWVALNYRTKLRCCNAFIFIIIITSLIHHQNADLQRLITYRLDCRLKDHREKHSLRGIKDKLYFNASQYRAILVCVGWVSEHSHSDCYWSIGRLNCSSILFGCHKGCDMENNQPIVIDGPDEEIEVLVRMSESTYGRVQSSFFENPA